MKTILLICLISVFISNSFAQEVAQNSIENNPIKKSENNSGIRSSSGSSELNPVVSKIKEPSNLPQTLASNCANNVLSGSFIINMGFTPQTVNNGLRPYGMVYDLAVNYKVPIIWSINPAKSKDGSDFTHNLITYSGGTFIVPAQFISLTVKSRITFWQGQGVIGAYSVSPFLPPIYDTITGFPKVMIDNTNNNHGLLANYYSNASIPSAAYSINSPSNLGNCFDVWTAPHSDPTWATHNFLYNFVTVLKGWIWAGCHTISILESSLNPMFPFNSLQFLTTGSLQCYNNGSCNGISAVHAGNASNPYNYFYPADPIMQFMATMDGATQNGSEKWVIPLNTSQWRATTRRGVTTSDGISPAEGSVLVYGPAFGNVANGTVMYSPGHSLNGSGTIQDRVAAQRSYLNFILLGGISTKIRGNINVPSVMTAGSTYSLSSSISSGISPYTRSWSCTIGGIFSSVNSSSPTYMPPSYIPNDTTAIMQVTFTDNCGRRNTESFCFTLLSNGTLPVELLSFTAIPKVNDVALEWTTASETNNDYFAIERSRDGIEFSKIGIVQGNGNSSITHSYGFSDHLPLTGISYYRLAQTDFDGQINYSQNVAVNFNIRGNSVENVSIIPSPVNDNLILHFISGDKNAAIISIYDILGSLCYKENVIIQSGENNIECNNLSGLNRGIYFMKMIAADGQVISTNFVKN